MKRGGKVIVKVATDISGKGIPKFLQNYVRFNGARIITNEYHAYNIVTPRVQRDVVKHKEHYVEDDIYTNTIQGFWSLLKRVWYDQHHHYRKKFTPLCVAEACWKYNHRKSKNIFNVFLRDCLN